MKNVTREEWLAALRSGEYKQGRGVLKEDGRFCCLGVLCDLADVPWGNYHIHAPYIESFVLDGASFKYSVYPPDDICKMMEVCGLDQYVLATENDRVTSFAEIADLIEANVPEGTVFPFEELS